MTFTEAAVEVLRRAGKPLHYKEIAEAAVRENLLSHVGQDPETTMGQRLAAMARREEERRVVAINPEGTFALTEWSVPVELVVEAKPPPAPGDDGEKPYRGREREPRPIHAQARRRMEAIAGGEEVQEERGGEQPRKERDERKDRERDRKRPPIPAEAVFDWLAQKQSGAPLAEAAADLAAKGIISQALAQDLPSLTAALLEDNRRRTEVGRKPAFIVDGERVTLVEFPSPEKLAEVAHSPQSGLGRPASATSLVQEHHRACVRALKARLLELETSGFEHVCAALLDKMGMRDLRVAKRSKEGPLYLARQRWGLSDLRVAVRLVRGRREISRQDVIELRKDLAHYSAQMAILLSPAEAGREARTDASAAAQAPVALFAGEALAEELVEKRVGVSVQVVEIADVDEAFFAAARAQKGGRDNGKPESVRPPEGSPAEPSAPVSTPPAPSENAPASAEASTSASESTPTAASNGSAPAAPAAAGEEKRGEDRDRRRRRDREEKPKLTSPADQAWGQPAGTPRKGLELASSSEAPAKSESAPAAEAPASDSSASAEASTSGESAASEAPSLENPADPASAASASDANPAEPA